MKGMRTTANARVRYGIVLLVASLGFTAACGDDASTDDCARVVDAFARSWDRCKFTSYDSAEKSWSKALSCGSAKGWDGSTVNACVNALNALDCGSVPSSPASCTKIVPVSGNPSSGGSAGSQSH